MDCLFFFHMSPHARLIYLERWVTTAAEHACNAGDPDLIPEAGSSPGGGNGNPLQYSCLENSMD